MGKFRSAIFLVVFLGLVVLFLVKPAVYRGNKAEAQSNLIPFGGQLLMVTYCCNGIKLTVGPPNGGDFLFMAGSRLYAFYQIFASGPWVLGNAFSGGFCLEILSYPPCSSISPTDGIIFQIGTSMR